tara:strand:- start:50662 stop:51678 length:1017 start_codon:yes stop_codon:yes gene_type:complete
MTGELMKTKDDFKTVVVGGGAAGIMAALRGVLNNEKVVLYLGSGKARKKSREMWVSKVENMPGYEHYKKGIVNPNKDTLSWIKESKFAGNLEVLRTSVSSIKKLDDGSFEVEDEKGGMQKAFSVVLATGIMDVQPEIQGSIEPVLPYANVQLIDYCIRCDGHHVQDKKTTVIGHSNTAGWVAILLKERYDVKSMTVLTNGKEPEFDEQVKKLHEVYGIKTNTSAIKDVKGNAKELILEGFELEDGSTNESEIAFISLGMIVYNELAKSVGAKVDERGFVITNEKGETNIEGLYAIGDLQADTKKQIYTSWDMAVDALDDIDNKIRRKLREQALENFGG